MSGLRDDLPDLIIELSVVVELQFNRISC